MKLLIELPTWLGDGVMTTPAIENLVKHYDNVEITLTGSSISVEALKNHPNVVKTYIIDKKIVNLYKTLMSLEDFEVFISFRGSLRAKIFKFFVSAKNKYQFDKNKYQKGHQVEKYNNFINDSLNIDSRANRLVVHSERKILVKKNKLLGINPGASYGSSKQWYPHNFAKVAFSLSSEYDIIIFGGPQDFDIAKDIENYLTELGIMNYQNLAAKLSITDLISEIANLDLFITCDSGPMHIAAALEIPTVSIFGPTQEKETSQWMNKKNNLVKKNLECQPCMERICPLGHHNCMKLIKETDVLDAVADLISL